MPKSPTSKSTIKKDPFEAVIPSPRELESFEEEVPRGFQEVEIETPRPALDFAPGEPDEPPEPAVARSQRMVRAKSSVRPKAPENASDVVRSGKQKLTVHLDAALADRVKNAAYWNPRLTIAGIAEQGIRYAIEKFEREHGGKYPPREGELIGGRPIK